MNQNTINIIGYIVLGMALEHMLTIFTKYIKKLKKNKNKNEDKNEEK